MNGQVRRYVAKMGVEPELLDVAAGISPHRVKNLNRMEIARFGLETNGFYETGWMGDPPWQDKSGILKVWTQKKGIDQNEYRTTAMRIGCRTDGRFEISYRRELAASEAGVRRTVRIEFGGTALYMQPEITSSYDEMSREILSADEIQRSLSAGPIKITETFARADKNWSNVSTLSTRGLPKAISEIRAECKNGMSG